MQHLRTSENTERGNHEQIVKKKNLLLIVCVVFLYQRWNQSSPSSSSLPSLHSTGITHTSDGLVFKVSATAREKNPPKKPKQLGPTRFHRRPSPPPTPPPPLSELPRKNLRWSYHMILLEAHECTGSSNVCNLNSEIRLGKREVMKRVGEQKKNPLKFWPSPAL